MRILVVEDDDRLATNIASGLNAAQYTVDIAHDGEEALGFTNTSAYDAMVLDVLLPRLDGMEMCRTLRAAGDRTPILILTAKDGVADRVAGLDCGADDYLTKPFAFDELLARIRALLRREAERKEPIIRLDDLSLDPATQQVRWENSAVELTHREYRVLETLIRRPRQIVPRDVIIDSVW